MAKAKVKQRKDDKGRVLQKGESQRKLDGMYIYTYVDPYGKRCYAYSKDLFTLREKEQDLIRAQMDGLDYYVGGHATINMAFDNMAHANSKKCVRSKCGKRNYNPFYYCGVCGRALAPSKRVKGDILLCYSSRIEENSPCKSNRVEIAKFEDAIMKTVNMYATVYLDEKGIKRAGKSKEVSSEEKLAVLEKKVKSLSSKKMMLYSDYKDDKLTREEYVKRSKAMVEQIDELHQKIEQLKSELPTEENSAGKFETQLENIINMESFDREKIQKVIKKVIINGEDNIEIVWNTDDPFFR